MKTFHRALAAPCIALILSGCATYVTSTQATAFNQSVATAASNLQASLAEVQSVEVGNQTDAFAKGGERTLEHLDLDPKLSDAVSKAITGQFAFLVSYSASMKSLSTPGTSFAPSVSALSTAAQKVETDAGALSSAVGETTLLTAANVQTLKTDTGNVASAFSSAGQGLLTIYGEEKAYRIANAADPAVQRYCADLEALLAEDPGTAAPKTGLAGILHADYEKKVAVLKNLATTAPPPGSYDNPNYLQAFTWRSKLVVQYEALLKDEQSGVARIVALRKAVAEIASAHAALARKDDKTFQEKIEAAAALLESAFKGNPGGAAAAPP
jgi:hypothetical protein